MNRKPLMKLLFCLVFVLSISACKKSSDTEDSSSSTNTTCGTNPYKIGTTATYSTSSSPYTVTGAAGITLSGKNYIKLLSSTSGSNSSYIYVDTNGDVWQYVPAITGADIGATEMIAFKQGKNVGDAWSYSFQSLGAPGMVSYKYNYTVLANNITFSLSGKTYTNCVKVKTTLETFLNGVSTGTPTQYSASTWACGIGLISSEVNGNPYSTLTNYVY